MWNIGHSVLHYVIGRDLVRLKCTKHIGPGGFEMQRWKTWDLSAMDVDTTCPASVKTRFSMKQRVRVRGNAVRNIWSKIAFHFTMRQPIVAYIFVSVPFSITFFFKGPMIFALHVNFDSWKSYNIDASRYYQAVLLPRFIALIVLMRSQNSSISTISETNL